MSTPHPAPSGGYQYWGVRRQAQEQLTYMLLSLH